MPNRINLLTYRELAREYRNFKVMVFITNRGITAEEAVELRREVREQNCRIKNVRNRLMDLVFKNEMGIEGLSAIMSGPMLVVEGEEPSVVAKIALKVSKKNAKLELAGAVMEKQIMGPEKVQMLSTMPTREELIGRISSMVTAPFRRVSAQAIAPFALLASQIGKIGESDGDSESGND